MEIFNFFLLILPILMVSTVLAKEDVASKFKASEVVPDVFGKIPKNLIDVSVKYPSGAKLNYGNELTPTQVKDIPSVKWHADPKEYYTLIMTDPDVPNRIDRSRGQVKHWQVVNIPGKKVDKGEIIAEYIGSGPPEGSGLHRYIVLVFLQPRGKIDFSQEEKSYYWMVMNRYGFSAEEFANKYSLKLLGGNLFEAKYDDYVPILYSQFKDL
uniref:Putative phosphatidylethanolamine-binding protein n=1 Tax=Nyssomyia neivai TaxID=330878 RepID=A0A1L8DQ58_9DIPT